jgi:hypothetical protein
VEAPFLSDPIIDWDQGCLRHLELVTSLFNAATLGSSLSLRAMIRAGFALSMTAESRIGSQVSLYKYIMTVGSAWSGVQADSRGLAAQLLLHAGHRGFHFLHARLDDPWKQLALVFDHSMQLVFVGGLCRVSVLERVTLGSMLSSHGMARLGCIMNECACSEQTG